jgi:hypothetical protein
LRKAVEPFPSFSRTGGSSFRRLEPVERLFLQTAVQVHVPIVKTILKPEVRICNRLISFELFDLV